LNSLILESVSTVNLYRSKYWATYNQSKKLGGQVNKGESGTTVFFWKQSTYLRGEAGCTKCHGAPVYDGKPCNQCQSTDKVSWLIRAYTVFNLDQCAFTDGIPTKLQPPKEIKKTKAISKIKIIKRAEDLVIKYAKTLAGGISHGGNRAYYSPRPDGVRLPNRESFKSDSFYYRVALHELTHSTGHESRLSRWTDFEDHRFGSEEYSKEELVAELGACSLSSYLDIDPKVERENSIAYLQSWSQALRDKPKEFIYASQQAFRGVNHILEKGL
jgi:antirestriction protein ArdC